MKNDKEKSFLNDATYVIWYGVNHLSHIVVPVGLTMLFSTYVFFVFHICSLLVNLVRPTGITEALEEGMTYVLLYFFN